MPHLTTTGTTGSSTPPRGPVLELESVRAHLGRGRWERQVFGPVSVGFEPGTMTAIMGTSGSGKSTLLHVAAGLRRPTSGGVVLDGVDLTGLSERRLSRVRRDEFGFVFQSYNLLPSLTVYDNVALPLRLRRERQIEHLVMGALASVGMGERGRARPDHLSGGQAQRVAIARAMAARPRILFGDEPTGALDAETAGEVMSCLRQVVDEGRAVVLVTHDERVARAADRAMRLTDGHLHPMEVASPPGREGIER